MVGNGVRNHDVGKRIHKSRQEIAIKNIQAYHVSKNALKKHHRIHHCQNEHSGHYKLCTIYARQHHQPLVELIGDVHEKGQEGMSENIIDLIPVPIGQHTIGNGVKTRNMVLVDKHRPIVLTDARKVVVISTNHHRIEQQKHKNGDNSKPTLFTTNSKNGKNLFHFFRKYLTNKKFIGTQTANIGSGAQFFETPSAKNRLRNNVCNRKLMQ